MGLAVPIINGRRYDYTAIDILIDGLPVLGRAPSSISYDHSLKPGIVKGGSPLPLGLTRGDYEASATIEMPKEEADTFRTLLAATSAGAGSAGGYMEARFEMTVAFAELGGPMQIDHLNGCRVTHDSESHSKGGDGLTVKFELFVQYIIKNGKMPLGVDAMIK
jgi:hypothetical protein